MINNKGTNKHSIFFIFTILLFLFINGCIVENATRAIYLEFDNSNPSEERVSWATVENKNVTYFSFSAKKSDFVGDLLVLKKDAKPIETKATFTSSTGLRKNAVYFVVAGVKFYYIPGSRSNLKSSSSNSSTMSPYTGSKPIFSWYTDIDPITTKTKDEKFSVSVIMYIGYDTDDTKAYSELSGKKSEIHSFVQGYFAGKNVDELKPENEELLKQDIKEKLNMRYLETSRVRDIAFTRFDVMEE